MSAQQGQQSNNGSGSGGNKDDGSVLLNSKEGRFWVLLRISASLLRTMQAKGIDNGTQPAVRIGDAATALASLKYNLTRLTVNTFGDTPESKLAIETMLNDLRSEFLILEADEPTATTIASLVGQNSTVYKRLGKDEDIRLIYLLPAKNWDDPLKCNIKLAAFADGPEYEALSYTWGLQNGAGGSLSILNHGNATLKITSNLDSALRDLRANMSPDDLYRVLWVDAVCIDQSHSEEKVHQMRQMPKIYSEAKRVIVWLGKREEKAEEAFKILKSMPELLKSLQGDVSGEGPNDIAVPNLKSLNAISDSPWWTRAWCRQEIIMAKEASIFLGSTSLDWRVLSKAFWEWSAFSVPWLLANPDSRSAAIQDILRNGFSNDVLPQLAVIEQWRGPAGLPTFLEMLSNHGNLRVTDPRDHVYALFGLVNSRDPCHADTSLHPDYTLRLSELLVRVAVHLIAHHGLDIISFATDGLSPSRSGLMHFVEFLPTWTPDWRKITLFGSGNFAFTNLLKATDPSQRMLADMASMWREGKGMTDNDQTETSNNGILMQDGNDLFVSLATFRPISPSLFKASDGLDAEPLQFSDTFQDALLARKGLFCSGFTLDKIESLGAETGSVFEKMILFSGAHLPDWDHTTPYPHVADQAELEAVIRTAIADQWPNSNDANVGYHRLGDLFEREVARTGVLHFMRTISDTNSSPRFAKHRRFFRSSLGYIGLAPPQSRKDDLLVVLAGATVPFVLHTKGEIGLHEFVGDWSVFEVTLVLDIWLMIS